MDGGRPQVVGVLRALHVGEDRDPAHLGGRAGGERRQLLLDVLHECSRLRRPPPHLHNLVRLVPHEG